MNEWLVIAICAVTAITALALAHTKWVERRGRRVKHAVAVIIATQALLAIVLTLTLLAEMAFKALGLPA